MNMKQLTEELEQVQDDKHEFADWCFGAVPKMVEHISKTDELIAELFTALRRVRSGDPELNDMDKLIEIGKQLGFRFSEEGNILTEEDEEE